MQNDNILAKKSYAFAIRIVKLSRYLNATKHEFVLSKQVLRSGTSIGALVSESRFAQSKADFEHKLTVALKEANETEYWINLLHDTEYITTKEYKNLHEDIDQLISLLVSITKTLKNNKSSTK